MVDSDEELEFEENLLRGNTMPNVRLQNRFSPGEADCEGAKCFR